jgi:geranylgeranyl diphosphate synthase type II
VKTEDYLHEKRLKVDVYLDRLFQNQGASPELREAVRYSLLAGGKRIRPILTIAASEACGGSKEWAIPVGAAIEMIHTYSLIHDDLPAMDNDDLRRGRPTSHKVFGEAMAILAGDTLLTESFFLLTSLEGIPSETLLKIVNEVARAAGIDGMAGGQALDLKAEGKEISKGELEILHRMKTGCLIQASVASGALLAGASEKDLMAIRRYGEAIGLAFQITDDILNVEGETSELGKRARSDEAHSKATYPSILGLENSKRLAVESSEKAIGALSPFGSSADSLRQIARYLVERRS